MLVNEWILGHIKYLDIHHFEEFNEATNTGA